MTEATRIFRNTVALSASKLVEKGVSICLSFLIARQLGPAALGVYSAAIVLFGLILVAADMGCTTFLVREVAKDRSRTAAYLLHLGAVALLLSVGFVAVVWLIIPHLGYSPELRTSVLAVTFAIMPAVLRTAQEAVFVAVQRVEFITCSALLNAALTLGGTLTLLHAGYGVVSLVILFTAAQFAGAISSSILLYVFVCRLTFAFSFRFALDLIWRIKVFAGSSILGGLLARPEVLILSLFKNDAQIGFYSAALRVIDFWQVIPETYMRNVFPVLSAAYHRGDRDKCQRIVDRSIKYLLAISMPLTMGIIVAAEPIVRTLFGPGFELSVPATQIMALYIPAAFLFELLWRLLAARNHQDLMLRAQVASTFVRISCGYVLIAAFGYLGAAVNVTVLIIAHNLLLIYYGKRDGTQLRIFHLAWRLSLAALVMGVGASMLVNKVELWVVVFAAAALNAALVIVFRGLSADDLALFRNIRQYRAAA